MERDLEAFIGRRRYEVAGEEVELRVAGVEGVRTGDIAEPGMRKVGTREMGDAVLAAL